MFLPEMEADHVIGVSSLLDGDDEGFRGVEDVGHKPSSVGGGRLRESRLQVESKTQAATVTTKEPEKQECNVMTFRHRSMYITQSTILPTMYSGNP